MFIVPFLALLVYNTSGVSIESKITQENINININNNKTCELCHILVNTINKELKEGNKTISDIINIVNDICHIIGGPSGKECIYIVEHIQEIVNYLTEGFNATQICIKLKCRHKVC